MVSIGVAGAVRQGSVRHGTAGQDADGVAGRVRNGQVGGGWAGFWFGTEWQARRVW